MRKMIDQKVGFGNGAQIYQNQFSMQSKIQDLSSTLDSKTDQENRFYRCIPETDLMNMVKDGFEDNHAVLMAEKEILKDMVCAT